MNHHDLEFSNLLFNIIPKTKPTEEKLGKLDFIKIKIIFAVTGTMEKVKKKTIHEYLQIIDLIRE